MLEAVVDQESVMHRSFFHLKKVPIVAGADL
jgi:hypothetical protein